MRTAALFSLPLLLIACGTPAPSGDSTTESATLQSLDGDGDGAPLARLDMTAWSSGALEVSMTATGLPSGEYRLALYDFGTCAIVREKAANPVLGSSGVSSVLPLTTQSGDLIVTANGTIETTVNVRDLKNDPSALEGRPVVLKDTDGQLVACGEIAADVTAKR